MLHRAVITAIVIASATAARALTLDALRVEATLVEATSKDPFRIRARLTGADPTGIVAGPVTIRFGALEARVPAGGFRRRKSVYSWRSYLFGVKKVTINVKRATLDVVGGGAELGDMPGPVTLALATPKGVVCGSLNWAGQSVSRDARTGRRSTRKVATGPIDPCFAAPDGGDHVPPHVLVTSPTGQGGTTTAAPTISIGGVASDESGVAGMTWSNDRGGGASFLATAQWSVADIDLQPGDNRITVSASDPGGNVATDVLDVTYNTNGLVFDGVPVAEPDAFFVGEAGTVAVRQSIESNPDLDPATVRLERIDDAATTPVGSMKDDGVLAGGDKIAGDGIHTGQVSFTHPELGLGHFRVSARTLSQPDVVAWSPVLTLPVVERVQPTEIEAAITLADDAHALLAGLIADGASSDDALPEVVTLARVHGALAAGPSTGGLGAWWVDAHGLLGGVLAYDEATRRGGRARERSAAPRSMTSPVPAGLVGATAGVGTRRSIILAPYFPDEEALQVDGLLRGSQCPQFDVESYAGKDASAERFKHLEEYGLILIASHGDVLFDGIGAAYRPEWGWSSTGAQTVVLTGTVLSKINHRNWDLDLRLGRMGVFPGGVAAILPTFVGRYSIRLPASLVYVGACRSSSSMTLASALFEQGAATYLGYDGYVTSAFASDMGVDLFTKLLEGKSVEEAFTPGQSDGASPPATFTMVGQPDTSLTANPVVNGSFEIASGFEASVTGFTVTGDGRIVGQLGSTLPTDGQRMALVSTGLGFTTASGEFSQPVCLPPLPAGATKLMLYYDWNFFSEEFLEYCGSQFQDSFEVRFGTTWLQSTKIDDLCGVVTPADVAFDKGGVYKTGWLTQAVDVTAMAGTTDLLSFAADDVGDSIFDSAILVDRVRVVAE